VIRPDLENFQLEHVRVEVVGLGEVCGLHSAKEDKVANMAPFSRRQEKLSNESVLTQKWPKYVNIPNKHFFLSESVFNLACIQQHPKL
jgi:hypothetical protein